VDKTVPERSRKRGFDRGDQGGAELARNSKRIASPVASPVDSLVEVTGEAGKDDEEKRKVDDHIGTSSPGWEGLHTPTLGSLSPVTVTAKIVDSLNPRLGTDALPWRRTAVTAPWNHS
jgi:hypothetical protein